MHRFCHCKHERHEDECEHHKRRRHHRKHRVVKKITRVCVTKIKLVPRVRKHCHVRVEFIRKHNRKRHCF